MIRDACEREQEVLDAIAANRWPDRLGLELSSHVSACGFCNDLGEVARALSDDYADAATQARLPSAGLVWWRAEIRARQEAGRVACRPITFVQMLTAVSGIGLAVFLLIWSGYGSLAGIGRAEFWIALANELFLLPLLLYLSIGVLAVLATVALYLALSDE